MISTAVGCLPTVLATGVSFVVGDASIAWLLRFVAKHSITVFIWYRVALAAVIAVLLGTGTLSPHVDTSEPSDRREPAPLQRGESRQAKADAGAADTSVRGSAW